MSVTSITSYVISLKNPINLLNTLSDYNLNPTLIEGINGNTLSGDEITNNTSKFYSYFGPKSVIGCALAHLKTWKKFLETNHEYCVIFEDDVVFENNFKNKLNIVLNNIPNDFDILYLGCFGCDNEIKMFTTLFSLIMNLQESVEINKYIKKPKFAVALHAYILSRQGAKKLIHYIDKKIYNHVDIMVMQLYSENKINMYSLNKRLAYQTSTNECKSMNASTYPYIINKTTNIEIDKMLKLNYYMSCSFLRIGNFNINATTVLFLILGIIFAIIKINIKTLTILFICLSIPDIFYGNYIDIIIFHYIIFIIPSILLKNF